MFRGIGSSEPPGGSRKDQVPTVHAVSSSSHRASTGDAGNRANNKRMRLPAMDVEDSEAADTAGDSGYDSDSGRGPYQDSKELSDPIHSSMEFPPSLLTVIDTPEFQRLRGLKQLGAAQYVFAGATHTRFEHSIGVSYLGMRFVRELAARQPELEINEMDVHCVGLAGLCHDLGHGPFSHLFDSEFLRGKDWTHEGGSVLMLRHLLKANRISLEVVYGFEARDLVFVEELILGAAIPGGVAGRRGRDADKSFLYDFINNERSGLDVDKLDYLLRDSFYTGVDVAISTSVQRLTQIARVLPDEANVRTVCFPEKAVDTLFGIFHARVVLHKLVYQHKVVKACEFMIRDILRLADPFLAFVSTEPGHPRIRMSESTRDMSVFAQLSDSVLDVIAVSSDENLRPAQRLLRRLRRRDLYRCCGHSDLEGKWGKLKKLAKEDLITRQMLDIAQEHGLGGGGDDDSLVADDFIADVMNVHHGKGDSNPVDGLRFYTKPSVRTVQPVNGICDMLTAAASQDSNASFSSIAEGVRCFQIQEARYGGGYVPHKMRSNVLRVFVKKEHKRAAVTECFRLWTRKNQVSSPLCHNSQTQPEDHHNHHPHHPHHATATAGQAGKSAHSNDGFSWRNASASNSSQASASQAASNRVLVQRPVPTVPVQHPVPASRLSFLDDDDDDMVVGEEAQVLQAPTVASSSTRTVLGS